MKNISKLYFTTMLALTLIFSQLLIVSAASTTKMSFGNFLRWTDYQIIEEDVGIGRIYTPECLVECHMPIAILHGGWLPSGTKELVNNEINYDFIKLNIKDDIVIERVDYLYNETFDTIIQNTTISCSPYNEVTKNGTEIYNENCTTINDPYTIIEWRWIWKDLSEIDKKDIYSDDVVIIDIVGRRSPNAEGLHTDIVPTILGNELTDFAWWNSSWAYKRNIVITNKDVTEMNTSYPIPISSDKFNMTQCVVDNKCQADLDDIRILYESPTDTYTEITRKFEQIDDNKTWFETQTFIAGSASSPATDGNTSYWLFYGNAITAGSVLNDTLSFPAYNKETNTLLHWDGNANDSTGNHINGVWTGTANYSDNNVTWDTSVGILNNANNVKLDTEIISGQKYWTLEAFVYKQNPGSIFFGKGLAGTHVDLDAGFHTANDKVYVKTPSSPGGTCEIYNTGTVYADNQWYYYVVQSNGTHWVSYIDGKYNTLVSCTNSLSDDTHILYVGRAKDNNEEDWDGYVDDLRFTDAALYTQSDLPTQLLFYQPNITINAEEPLVPPNNPPQWYANGTNYASGQTWDSTRNYGFQTNWTDSADTTGYNYSYIEHNFTGTVSNYSTSRSDVNTSFYNFTGIPAGYYEFKWYANDSVDLWNTTDTWNYTIAKIVTTTTVSPTTQSINYGDTLTQYCSDDSEEAECSLWRGTSSPPANNLTGQNDTSITLSAVTWYFNATTPETENYTGSVSATQTITVIKGYANVNVYINDTENSDVSLSYPSDVNITVTINITDATQNTFWLYINDTETGAQSGQVIEFINRPIAKAYNITAVYNISGNYTLGNRTQYLVADKGNVLTRLFINGTQGNTTQSYPNAINATGWRNDTFLNEGSLSLYRNGVNVTTLLDSNTIYEDVLLGNGTYTYVLFYNDTENYTQPTNISYGAFVNKGDVLTRLFINGTQGNTTQSYPNAINATGWRNDTFLNEGSLSLYRNGVNVTTLLDSNTIYEDVLLGNGTYTYLLWFNGTENYTEPTNISYGAFVNKGNVLLTMLINGTQNSNVTYSYVYPNEVNVTITKNSTYNNEGRINIFRNDVNVTSETNVNTIYEVMALPNATFNYIGWYNGTENYTEANISYGVLINLGTPVVKVAFNGTESDRAYDLNQVSNATGWLDTPSNLFGHFYRNGSLLGYNGTPTQYNNDGFADPENLVDGDWSTKITESGADTLYVNTSINPSVTSVIIHLKRSLGSNNQYLNVYNSGNSKIQLISFSVSSSTVSYVMQMNSSYLQHGNLVLSVECSDAGSSCWFYEIIVEMDAYSKTSDIAKLPIGAYNYTFVFENANYTVTSLERTMTVSLEQYHGINATFNNRATSTPVDIWTLNAENATTQYTNSTLTSPTSIKWDELPTGLVNLSVNGSSAGYGASFNETIRINDSMGFINLTFDAWKLQQFRVINTLGDYLSATISFDNSTFNYTFTGTKLLVTPDLLPSSSVTTTFLVPNYVTIVNVYQINTSSTYNETILVENSGVNLRVFSEDTQQPITSYKVIITNGTFSTQLTIDKTSTLAFLDDDIDTSTDYDCIIGCNATEGDNVGKGTNYTYGFGYTNGNFSISYQIANSSFNASNISINILDPITETYSNVWNLTNSDSESLTTDYFIINNIANDYGDYPSFSLEIDVGANAIISINEITLLFPYRYNKNGFVSVNSTEFGLATGVSTRFIFSSPIYLQRSYFITPTIFTSTTLDAYLTNLCFYKNFKILQRYSLPQLPISGATISVYRQFNLTSKVIAQEKSNAEGSLSVCVEQAFPYTMSVSASGYSSLIIDEQTFYNNGEIVIIQLVSGVVSFNLTNPLQGITLNITPITFYLSNSSAPLNVTCYAIADLNNANYVYFNISRTYRDSEYPYYNLSAFRYPPYNNVSNITINTTTVLYYNNTVSTPSGAIMTATLEEMGTYNMSCGIQYVGNTTLGNQVLLSVIKRSIFIYSSTAGLISAGSGLTEVLSPTALQLVALLLTVIVSSFFVRHFGVQSAFIFLLVYGFILIVLGAWGFNIPTGVFILGILIWLSLMRLRLR